METLCNVNHSILGIREIKYLSCTCATHNILQIQSVQYMGHYLPARFKAVQTYLKLSGWFRSHPDGLKAVQMASKSSVRIKVVTKPFSKHVYTYMYVHMYIHVHITSQHLHDVYAHIHCTYM